MQVDRGRRLLRTSARARDPSGKCSELLARFSARDVLLESIGPCDAQPLERPARRRMPVDRCDLEI
jgi:hypothetical protein